MKWNCVYSIQPSLAKAKRGKTREEDLRRRSSWT